MWYLDPIEHTFDVATTSFLGPYALVHRWFSMTFVPHYRLSLIGRIGGVNGPEMFSCNLALARFDGTPLTDQMDPNNTVWNDIAADCVAWFGRPGSSIHMDAVLQMVKIARIGADGSYTAAPVERLVNRAGDSGGARPSNSQSFAVTLKTNGDLGRVKGRFYPPIPYSIVQADGLSQASYTESMETSAQQFVNALNNQPGLDVLGLAVAVASQGRRNKDGTVRVPPANHLVTSVAVGRVPDTIRRRRNKLKELHTYSAVGGQ